MSLSVNYLTVGVHHCMGYGTLYRISERPGFRSMNPRSPTPSTTESCQSAPVQFDHCDQYLSPSDELVSVGLGEFVSIPWTRVSEFLHRSDVNNTYTPAHVQDPLLPSAHLPLDNAAITHTPTPNPRLAPLCSNPLTLLIRNYHHGIIAIMTSFQSSYPHHPSMHIGTQTHLSAKPILIAHKFPCLLPTICHKTGASQSIRKHTNDHRANLESKQAHSQYCWAAGFLFSSPPYHIITTPTTTLPSHPHWTFLLDQTCRANKPTTTGHNITCLAYG